MLRAHDLTMSYEDGPLLEGVSLVLQPGDRVGLVGPNGSGKSTLLRLLAGLERPRRGSVALGPGDRVGYLAQQAPAPDAALRDVVASGLEEVVAAGAALRALERSLAEAPDARVLALYAEAQERYARLDGWAADGLLAEARAGLGLAHLDADAPVRRLSGGEQVRALLAGTLVARPSVLLLDEPTNHLDLDGVRWLESYLAGYGGAVMLTSHDRRFLDSAVSRVLELEGGGRPAELFDGGWTRCRAERERRRTAQEAAYAAQEAYRRRLQDDVARARRQALATERTARGSGSDGLKRKAKKVARKAQSREHRLERQMASSDWVERPDAGPSFIVRLRGQDEPGRLVAALRGVQVRFGERTVLDGVDLELHGGDRMAVHGRNGAGKSTLLGVLAGRVPADAGQVLVPAGAGSLPQTHHDLPADTPLLDFYRSRVLLHEDEARTLLGHFEFGAERMARRIGTLSPGERTRLLVATLVASESSPLLLDEPTNHLDPYAQEVVEAALRSYAGTLVLVSHDRAFVEAVGCNRHIEVREGKVR